MQVRAVYRYVRMSPQKVRQVVDLVRGQPVDEALAILQFTPRAAARPVHKLIKSAIANAENNYMLSREDLYVAEIMADGGPTLKRWRPRARGRADMIRKRTCHVTVVLDEYEEFEQV
ncbi:MAG: 50S ribosomal protein L22 [Chloroflexia bacterium]|nr:50S ribosomal protein L22 [Chloroflexia bacterium]